ncbi:MAG: hypothetical protein V3T76_01040 [candidate division NC10 bacterium]
MVSAPTILDECVVHELLECAISAAQPGNVRFSALRDLLEILLQRWSTLAHGPEAGPIEGAQAAATASPEREESVADTVDVQSIGKDADSWMVEKLRHLEQKVHQLEGGAQQVWMMLTFRWMGKTAPFLVDK